MAVAVVANIQIPTTENITTYSFIYDINNDET